LYCEFFLGLIATLTEARLAVTEDERVGIVRALLFEYLESPSLRHIRDPRSVVRLAERIIEKLDRGQSIWKKWDARRETIVRAVMSCWIPVEDLREYLNRMNGPTLTITDVEQRLRAFEEELSGTFHDEDFRDGCRAIYEKEKAEGTDLLAIIGRIRDHLELEEKRVEREREVARKEWEQQDLINREQRLHSGADCGWVRPTGSPFYYCRKNGRTFRLSQPNRDFVLLHQVSTLSHEESGIFIGKYQRRREATRALSVVAYSPDQPSA